MGTQEETIMNNLNENTNENSTEDNTESQKNGTDCSSVVTRVINGLIVTLVVVFTLLLRSDAILTVSHRGFFCDDLSLRYPVKPQTVSTKVLISASTLACVLLVSLSEFYVVRCKKFLITKSVTVKKKSFSIPSWVGPGSQVILLYFMGAAANSILTDIGKNVIGWPRPNFMAYCQPNVTCDSVTNKHTYITNFKCMNLATQEELEDALKSFPSAHASFAAYVAFFLAFYIQERFRPFPATLKTVLGPFLQLLVISTFWWSALTRVSDYVHHPLDVLAGLLLGTLVACWTRHQLKILLNDIDQNHKTLKYSLT